MSGAAAGRVLRPTGHGALGVAMLDQALSSGSNVVVALIVARTLDLGALGGFAVAFAVFSLSVELSRSMGVEALAIRVRDVNEDDGLAGATSVAVGVGLVASLGCAVAGLLLDGPIGQALRVMAVFVVFAVVQDTLRNAFIAVGRPERALLSDGLWVAVQCGTLVWFVTADDASAATAVAAWGVAAAAAAIGTIVVFDIRLHPRAASEWLRSQRKLWPRLLGEAVLRAGFAHLLFIVLAVVVGAGELGRFRAAQIVFGPVSIALLLAPLIAVPNAARRASAEGIRAVALATSMVLVSGALAIGAVIWIAPDEVGRLVLGDNWTSVRDLVPITAVMFAASGLVTGAIVGLRAVARVDLTLRLRATSGPLTLGAGTAAAHAEGVAGAAAAIALVRSLVAVGGWRLLVGALRDLDREEVPV